jgi:hypothetical protein
MAEIRPLIAAEPMLRAPRPEIVAELNAGSSACELAGAKQIAKANVNAESKVTLTSILSQRERRIDFVYGGAADETRSAFLRSLLPEGEGEDEGSVLKSRDSDFKFEMNERKFNERMIKKNYFEADAGKWKIASSTGTLASAFSITVFCLSGSPLRPSSIENGMNTPPIFS